LAPIKPCAEFTARILSKLAYYTCMYVDGTWLDGIEETHIPLLREGRVDAT